MDSWTERKTRGLGALVAEFLLGPRRLKLEELPMTGREAGTTTRQMANAARGAVYVWVNWDFRYPKTLAATLGRTDLEIISPGMISGPWWRGRRQVMFVVDHAAELTFDQTRAIAEIQELTKLGGL